MDPEGHDIPHAVAQALVDMAGAIDTHHRWIETRLAPPKGKVIEINGTVATAAGFSGSGPIALGFTPEGPPDGLRWYMQWLNVWVGTSPTGAAVANLLAALMVGRSPIGPGAPVSTITVPVSVTDVRMTSIVVPTAGGLSVPDKNIVRPQQQAYLLLGGSGLAASTVYNATLGLIVCDDTDESAFW